MSCQTAVVSPSANNVAASELASLAIARREVLGLTKQADLFGDAAQLFQQGMTSARPYLDQAATAARPHVQQAADWVNKNPQLAMTLGGGLTGAALGGVGNLTGRKRKGQFLSDILTGGLAGTAVGGGLAALHGAYSGKAPGAAPTSSPSPAGVPGAAGPKGAPMDAITAKTKFDELSQPTAGSIMHDVGSAIGNLPKRYPLLSILGTGELAGSGLNLARQGNPAVSSHVADLNKALTMPLTPALESHLGGSEAAKRITDALKALSQSDRHQTLLKGIAGQNVGLKAPLATEEANKVLSEALTKARSAVDKNTSTLGKLQTTVQGGIDANRTALGLREQMSDMLKAIRSVRSQGGDYSGLQKQLNELQKQYHAALRRPDPLKGVDLSSVASERPGLEELAKMVQKRLDAGDVTITPEQLGRITSHGGPLLGHAPDGLLHRMLGVTLPGSGPRRLLDYLRGRQVAAPASRLARMGYTDALAEAPGLMNKLRRGVSNTSRFSRSLPARLGLMALPALGLEARRMYNEGAKQKADLQKFIQSLELG